MLGQLDSAHGPLPSVPLHPLTPVQLITTEDGKLITGALDEASVPALESYMYRQLVMLGERCYGHDKYVNQLMATMAKAITLDAQALIQQSWFQEVGNPLSKGSRLEAGRGEAAPWRQGGGKEGSPLKAERRGRSPLEAGRGERTPLKAGRGKGRKGGREGGRERGREPL